METNIKEMNYEDLKQLNQAIKEELMKHIEQQIMANMNGAIVCCHHCGNTHLMKSGINKQGKQRYFCKNCNRIMIAYRNVLTFSTKKSFSQWVMFLRSMLDGDSLEVSADKVSISKRTAFRWRHKILYILNDLLNQEVLYDTVWLDETLFPVVYKNCRKANKQISKRGMSKNKVNVSCAIDVNGNTILQVSEKGRVSSKALCKTYCGKIKKDSIVVSDSLRSYHRLMEKLEITWKKIPSKKQSFEEYTLDPINRLHALLKDFTYKYKGISIKYLQGYLALFDYQNRRRKHYKEDVFLSIMKDIFQGFCNLRCKDIDASKSIYA